MKIDKATPGPWSAVNNPSSNYGLEIVADVKVKAKRVVCRVSGPDRDANARLIAASPTMADYLRELAGAGDTRAAAILESIDAAR